jgi:ribonuclease HI
VTVKVFADGSSGSRAGKPVGWGWIVSRDNKVLLAGYGGAPSGTNNVSELTAAIEGLEAVATRCRPFDGEAVLLVCDSQYVLGMASGAYTPTKNVELAEQVRALSIELGVTPVWVPGHTLKRDEWKTAEFHVLMNHRCDQLAKKGKLENTPQENPCNPEKATTNAASSTDTYTPTCASGSDTELS